MKTLELLPIPTKNMLEESKVLPIIQRWAQTKTAVPQLSEGDGYSSENTSRAHTPLNTPELLAKQSVEGDTDTPKKLVFRRLKIISENSMDSAISDTTSELEGKEGKEDLDQLEAAPMEVPEEQQQQQQQQDIKTAVEAPVESSKAQPAELEAEPEAEVKESNGAKLEEPMAMETPSQDEEEGVSDVESERSQEQTDKIVDVSDLATRLLDSWKELKVRGSSGQLQVLELRKTWIWWWCAAGGAGLLSFGQYLVTFLHKKCFPYKSSGASCHGCDLRNVQVLVEPAAGWVWTPLSHPLVS